MRKVVILGNSWHGNWSLSLFQALKKENISVQHMNVRPYDIKTGIYTIDSMFKKYFVWRINQRVRNIITGNETLIIITPYHLTKKTWDYLKSHNTKNIVWLGDNPFRKENAELYLPYCHHIFVVDKSWIKNILPINEHASLLPHAFLESVFFPLPEEEKLYDVIFVGDSFGGNSEGLYRMNILKALVDSNINIALFGDEGWLTLAKEDKYSFLKNICKGPIHTREELNKKYNQSKIVLNIHHRQLTNGANQRVFEASGAGVFQISDHQELIEELFGDTIQEYQNTEELIQKIHYFLLHSEEMKEKAKKAHQIAEDHTYSKRISSLLDS